MRTPQSDRLSEYFAYLKSVSPPALKVWATSAEPEALAALEGVLGESLRRIESGARQHRAFQEPQLSKLVVQMLSAVAIPATAEEGRNDRIDLIVRHPAEPSHFLVGRCNVHDGYQRHRTACQQLLERCARSQATRGFCVEFFLVGGMHEKLSALRTEMAAEKPFHQVDAPVDREIQGAFRTAHRLPSGTTVELLHLGCDLS